MEKQRIYFPNLNGLRFIAAALVIVHHIEQLKSIYGMKSYWGIVPAIEIIGKLGVVLFFVLSGFLITYLLLAEEKSEGKISVRHFYLRRVLRIWPLYYFIILLALFVLPNITSLQWPGFGKDVVHKDLALNLALYVFFLPNLVNGFIPFASQAWSIGAEEQFYLVWPVLLRFIKRNRLLLMLAIIGFYLLVGFLLEKYSIRLPHGNVFKAFWTAFNIDCMAIGGIFALALFHRSRILNILMNLIVFYSTMVLLVFLLALGYRFPSLHYEAYAVLFGIVILNFAANEKLKNWLEFRPLSYLGTISYGLYMYHPLAISISIVLLRSLHAGNNWLIYPLSFLLTIGIAALSYRYFEQFFLRLKKKYSTIESGNVPGK